MSVTTIVTHKIVQPVCIVIVKVCLCYIIQIYYFCINYSCLRVQYILIMSQTKEKLDIFSENLLAFQIDPTGSSQTVHNNVAQNTRKQTMTEKGLEYATTIRKKVALSKAQEFKRTVTDFRLIISTTQSQYELKNDLEGKIEQYKAALQAFD